MKQSPPRRQALILLAAVSLLMASVGASVVLDPSSIAVSMLPPCTTLAVSGVGPGGAGRDTELTNSTVTDLSGDPATSTDPGESTTSSTDPADDTTTTSTDPGAPTTTSTDPPGDSTTTTSTDPPGDSTTTTTSDPGGPTSTDPPEDTTTTSSSDPGASTTSTDPPDDSTTTSSDPPEETTTTGWCSPGTTDGEETTTSSGTTTTGQGGDGPKLQFLSRGKDPVASLRIGRWEDAFRNEGGLFPDFVSRDRDSFLVRVNDVGANTRKGVVDTVKITLRTDSADNAYDDGPVTLDLVETGMNTSEFDSRLLLLVTNRADDEQETDKGVADSKANDRSFRVALSAKVIARYAGKEASVGVLPGYHEVKLHITALTDQDGVPLVGEPFLDTKPLNGEYNPKTATRPAELYRDIDGNGAYTERLSKEMLVRRVLEDVRYSNEVLAQIGVRLVPGDPLIEYKVADGDLADAVVTVGPGDLTITKLTKQEQALHDRPWYTPSMKGKDDVEVVYVKKILLVDKDLKEVKDEIHGGFAFAQPVYGKLTTKPQFNDSLVISNVDPLFLLAHEAYHIVAQAPFHPGNNINLMRPAPQRIPVLDKDLKVTDSRRLDANQTIATKDKYLLTPRR
jgi:hypothetical protein